MLCCIGDLVEDVVAWLSTDIAHGTDTTVEIHRRRGGSAANVAAAAAGVGAGVRFVGRVGSDPAGSSLVAQLEAVGVDVVVERGGRTGTIIVLVDPTGERTMLPDRASAVDLGPVDDSALDGVDWLHVPAYSLVEGPIASASLGAIDRISSRGGAVSIDASSVAIITEFGVPQFRSMITEISPDVVLCNADEAALLGVGETRGLDGATYTVVKDGPRTASVVDDSGSAISAPAVNLVDVRDTTGAGDAFAAGFIVAMIQNRGVEAALMSGHQVAAGVLTGLAP